jgi:hypothetical protein
MPLTPADPKAQTRIWKITSDTLRSNRPNSECILFLFLALSALVATIPCFSELHRLVNSDAISHTVKLLLQ